MADHYESLGVSKDASAEEIKRVYKRKSAKAHPDRGGDGKEMVVLNQAYHVLGDEKRRAAYDRGESTAPEKSLDSLAIELTAALTQEWLQHGAKGHCVTALYKEFNKRLGQMKEGRAQTQTIKSLAEAALSRTKRKSTKVKFDMMQQVLAGHLSNINQSLAMIDRSIEVASRAIALLEEYDREEEVISPYDAYSQSISGLYGNRR